VIGLIELIELIKLIKLIEGIRGDYCIELQILYELRKRKAPGKDGGGFFIYDLKNYDL
jgi:hypothetical protein